MKSFEEPFKMVSSSVHLLLLLVISTPIASGACPSMCQCTPLEDPKSSIVCTHANLTGVLPGEIPSSTKNLDLSWNEIGDLTQSDVFPRGLKELSIARNRLRTLPRLSLPSLLVANFEYNQIGEIPAHFSSLRNLQILMLAHNLIDSIAESAFDGLPELHILELSDNKLEAIPPALSRLNTLRELNLANNRIVSIDSPFSLLTPSIVLLELRGNPIVYLVPDAFTNLHLLQKLILSGLRNLTEVPDLNGTESLETLRIDRCSVRALPPQICHHSRSPNLKSLDLKSNRISEFPPTLRCGHLKLLDLSRNLLQELPEYAFGGLEHLHDLHLAQNQLHRIEENTFYGLNSLKTLDLSSNLLEEIHPYAFRNVDQLHDLNVGNNIFKEMPTEGLENVVHLKAFNNPHLKEFPGPSELPHVRTLVLSYAYHCCSFLGGPGSRKSPKNKGIDQLEPSPLNETVLYPDEREFDEALSTYLNLSASLWDDLVPGKSDLATNLWKEFGISSTADSPYENSPFIPIGGVGREIQCIPAPGPFMPCNDLFDWWTLRCGVWIVFLMALMGNGCVIFVLIFARTKMDVPRFLVCNLAIADFFMGVYLGFLAVVDSATFGEFRRFALNWQFSGGCQMAGFLGVLSSELSVYTLAVITMERHYAITHAMHLNKRLSLRHAVYIMAGGWVFALSMAFLPLVGISDYRKFAVCLPFEVGDSVSLTYVVFLMFANGVAFLILMGCYLKMYCSIRGSQAWNSNDTRIAKRMALLVFTDLLCWAPIAFFSLTAMFGLQLVSLEEAKVFTVFILPLNSCCNPFLYAILTKQFKKDCVLICKAIEESRVTRGIGRCRHSSNFSNRQTANNTGSLGDKSSRDGQPCICHSGCSSGGRGELNTNAKHWFIPVPERWGRFSPLARFLSEYVFCQRSKERSLKERDDYRMRNVRRYLYNNATNNFVPDVEKNHQRHPSVSSDNFSSSRSDSWRTQGRCGNPLRLLEPRRRNSWAVTRKPSQDSNLSNSRNDSSATSNSNSTATWRLSRSSVSSDATNSSVTQSGGSIKRISGMGSPVPPSNIKLLMDKSLPEEEEDTIQAIEGVDRKSSQPHQHQTLERSDPVSSKHHQTQIDDDDEIEEDEPSAKIATNRPRLVRQSAFFSEELVIEPEVCPVHGPLVDGTYDNENEDDRISEEDEEVEAEHPIEEREMSTLSRMSMPTYPVALVLLPGTAREEGGGETSSLLTQNRRSSDVQFVRFSEPPSTSRVRWHSADDLDVLPSQSSSSGGRSYPGHSRKVKFDLDEFPECHREEPEREEKESCDTNEII